MSVPATRLATTVQRLGRMPVIRVPERPAAPPARDRYQPSGDVTVQRLNVSVNRLARILATARPQPPVPAPPGQAPTKPKAKHRPMRVKDLPSYLNVNYGGAGGVPMPGVNVNATGPTRASYHAAQRDGKILADLVKTGEWFDARGRLKYTARQMADRIADPYTRPLQGKRPGGADMVVLDEVNDRLNVNPKAFAEALRLVKKRYPDRPLVLYVSHPDRLSPVLLKAVETFADRVLLEMYRWESQYPGGNVTSAAFDEFLRPVQRVAPRILDKVVPVLGVDQRPGPYDFDNSSRVDFKHFLNEEVHALKNHPLLEHMKGIGNYPAYGMTDDTKQWFSKLADWYVKRGHHGLMPETKR